MENKQRLCLECSAKVFGRKDKVFCSDYCRNSYNNRANESSNKFVRQINTILRKNRKILENLNPTGKVTIDELKLAEQGFNFHYYTNIYTTQKGSTYYFCYDYGYRKLENNLIIIVIKQDYIK